MRVASVLVRSYGCPMTEIQCPACSALLSLSLSVPGSASGSFAKDQQPVIEKGPSSEVLALAEFNAEVTSALREFLAVHPWPGHRLPGEIFEDFMAWCRAAPDGSSPRLWAAHNGLTKNRVSKLLVSEIGATFYKGPKGRMYRLPESLQPPGGDGASAVAGAELAGEGSLELSGVASLPLAEHVAAVKAQAAAEDSAASGVADEGVSVGPGWKPPIKGPVEYMFVTKDGVRQAVPLKSRGDVASLVQEEAMQEPADYSLPEGTFVDGPTIFPVEAGPAPAVPSGSWWVYLTDAESDYEPDALEQVAMERLPDRLLLADQPALRFDDDGQPYLLCLVHSADTFEPGYGVVPAPSAFMADEVTEAVVAAAFTENMAVAEAAAAPLPSSADLAAAAGHEALERARAAAAWPQQPVFLAAEDLDAYEGADPGDWG